MMEPRGAARTWPALILVAIGALGAGACGGGSAPGGTAQTPPAETPMAEGPAREEGAPPVDTEPSGPGGAGETVNAALFFIDRSGDLAPEMRRWPPAGSPALEARRLIEALVQGPREGLLPTLPAGTQVRAVHFGADGTAYVDLDQAFSRGLSIGSRDALVAVRSLVETLAANISGCARVKILVEGEEVRELGGHLDLTSPLVPESAATEVPGGKSPRDGTGG